MAKNIKYKVTDLDALKAAYPELIKSETVVREVVDHKKLYALVKANNGIGRPVEGVTILTGEASAPVENEDTEGDDAVDSTDDDAEDEGEDSN